MNQILTREEARALCDRVLAKSQTDGAEVTIESRRHGNTRYAVNRITTAGEASDLTITVTAHVGRRSASVTFNDPADDTVAERVATAERLAALAPEDPEQMPLLGAQEYLDPAAHFAPTAELGPDRRAESVKAVVDLVGRQQLEATGFIERVDGVRAVANTNGLFAYHRSTQASHTMTVRTTDGTGSGWAGTTHNDWTRLTAPIALAQTAMDNARASRPAGDVAAGDYTVVLEPTAVGNLVQLLAFALDARAADEGRSAFAKRGGGNRIGERVAGDQVTLLSDPRDPDLLEAPFTGEGLPVGRTVWIENGVLRRLAYGRFWAQKSSRQPVPFGGGIKLLGGEGATSDLVSSVERGLLVTRFWYIRGVDPRTLTYTGLTRDGTFRIENGRVTGAVKNLRFNQSVLAMLNNIVRSGATRRVVASESGGLGRAVVVPPLVVRNFAFTSVSDAV